MLQPDDIAGRLARLGLDPTVYHLSDIAHDIADTVPRGCPISHRRFRLIAERNRQD